MGATVRLTTLDAVVNLQNLLATIHAGFQINVMRAMQFACYLVFYIGICSKGVVGASHVTL